MTAFHGKMKWLRLLPMWELLACMAALCEFCRTHEYIEHIER